MQYGKQSLFETPSFYAIGDIHGSASNLESLLLKIKQSDSNPFFVFVGDLLGFGGENLKTLKILSNLKKEFPGKVFILEGNHDNGIKQYLKTGKNFPHYYNLINELLNKESTVDDFQLVKDLFEKEEVIHIFEDMIPYFETDSAIITHAPICPKIWSVYGGHNYAEEYDDEEISLYGNILDKMIWELQISFEDIEGSQIVGMNKFLICGHQFLKEKPTKTAHKTPRVFKHRAYLDCGCGYRNNRKLFALQYPSKKIIKS